MALFESCLSTFCLMTRFHRIHLTFLVLHGIVTRVILLFACSSELLSSFFLSFFPLRSTRFTKYQNYGLEKSLEMGIPGDFESQCIAINSLINLCMIVSKDGVQKAPDFSSFKRGKHIIYIYIYKTRSNYY